MKYWDIWNEPDLNDGDDEKFCWGGTRGQFFDFFEIAAKHLKSCFPELKIGGPSIARNKEWTEEFLAEMSKRNVPLDFFSWHIYATDPNRHTVRANCVREMLDKNGYTSTESILNEWNYLKNWTDKFHYTVNVIGGVKGAAFTMACMSLAQRNPIDMLMYYDMRPGVFCGAFDIYTRAVKKGYYPFYWYGMFYDTDHEVRCVSDIENIYTLCGADKNGKTLTVVTYYTDDDEAAPKEINVDFGRNGMYEIYTLDKTHDAELTDTTDNLSFTIPANSCILIKEI